MGNCVFGGVGEEEEESAIKVITSNGGIMQFYPPITASSITAEFPGHALFSSQHLFWKPVSHHDRLLSGHSYYLLPLHTSSSSLAHGHVRSNSIPADPTLLAPYRMSFDYQGSALRRSYTEPFSRYSSGNIHNNKSKKEGVWKVKLVIRREQLVDILSEEESTQELIDSVRTVAKCGHIGLVSNSTGFSDQWSFSSSSRNASSNNDAFLLDF